MYGLGCHPSKSYSASLGNHCVIESATPSLLFLPDLRICLGTTPLNSNVNFVFFPGNNTLFNRANKTVSCCSKTNSLPSCFSSKTDKFPSSLFVSLLIRSLTLLSGSLMLSDRTSIWLPGLKALKYK